MYAATQTPGERRSTDSTRLQRRSWLSDRISKSSYVAHALNLTSICRQVQAGRALVVQTSALAQKAEYIWMDGNEGAEGKASCFL